MRLQIDLQATGNNHQCITVHTYIHVCEEGCLEKFEFAEGQQNICKALGGKYPSLKVC